MTPVIRMTIFLLVGCALGYFSAHYVISGNMGGLTIENGSWTAWRKVGLPDADPYTRAHFALRQELPLSGAEQMTYSATTDDTAAVLTAGCSYVVTSGPLPARAWGLSVARQRDNLPMQTSSGRTSFNSNNVVRTSSGDFRITLSASAAPGNWLPLEADESDFKLMLHLINPERKIIDRPETAKLPKIALESCR